MKKYDFRKDIESLVNSKWTSIRSLEKQFNHFLLEKGYYCDYSFNNKMYCLAVYNIDKEIKALSRNEDLNICFKMLCKSLEHVITKSELGCKVILF